MGRLKSSEAVLHRLLRAQPENITARYNLGVLYYHGHFEKLAEEQWLKTVELDDSHADAYRNLCYLNYSWKDFKTALQYAEQAKSAGVTIPQELLDELLTAE
jgi:Flp pilus assembly protein TadD